MTARPLLPSAVSVLVFACILPGCSKDDNPTQPSPQPTVQPLAWESTSLATGTVRAFTVDNIGTVFASVEGDGIYKTTDNGATWTKPMNGPFQSATTSGYARVLLVDGYTLWAATENAGIHRSTDEGVTWAEVSAQSVPVERVFGLCAARGTVFCGAENGIFVLGSGDRWVQIDSRPAYAICGSDKSTFVFAGSGYDIGQTTSIETAAILWSGDRNLPWRMTAVGAATWVSVVAQAPNGTYFAGTTQSYDNSMLRHDPLDQWWVWTPLPAFGFGAVHAMAISTTNDVFVSSGGVYRSSDNGNSWAFVSGALSGTHIWALATNAAGYVFAGTDAGVWRALY